MRETRDNRLVETPRRHEQDLVESIEETPPNQSGRIYNESTIQSSASETATSWWSASDREDSTFPTGLEFRNVYLDESEGGDSIADKVKSLPSAGATWETKEERLYHERQWDMDRELCENDFHIEYFQHSIMMSLPARHCLHFVGPDRVRHLLCSVKSVWTCPQMPTRDKPLSPPEPDLAVCFHRQVIIPDNLWRDMPQATRRLACYENGDEIAKEKVFHFLTIQTVRSHISPDNDVGKLQSLNNASQSLHNMFEFFRDAGPKHEKEYFDKVRFFSVVASTEGLTIRIHRATKSDRNLIIPDYPLSFKYVELFRVYKREFTRKAVFDIFKKIQVDYGVKMLGPLLHRAAKDIMKRLTAGELRARRKKGFYRYGQKIVT